VTRGWGLGHFSYWVMASLVACVDGSIPAGQGMSTNANPSGSNASAGGVSGAGSVAVRPCNDTQPDPAHCGSCSTACAQGQVCDRGTRKAPVTSCTAPQVACTGVCADLTSTAHCGSCEQVCVSGQTCSAGSCVCPGAQTACNRRLCRYSNQPRALRRGIRHATRRG
jgi:hypothetical protein